MPPPKKKMGAKPSGGTLFSFFAKKSPSPKVDKSPVIAALATDDATPAKKVVKPDAFLTPQTDDTDSEKDSRNAAKEKLKTSLYHSEKTEQRSKDAPTSPEASPAKNNEPPKPTQPDIPPQEPDAMEDEDDEEVMPKRRRLRKRKQIKYASDDDDGAGNGADNDEDFEAEDDDDDDDDDDDAEVMEDADDYHDDDDSEPVPRKRSKPKKAKSKPAADPARKKKRKTVASDDEDDEDEEGMGSSSSSAVRAGSANANDMGCFMLGATKSEAKEDVVKSKAMRKAIESIKKSALSKGEQTVGSGTIVPESGAGFDLSAQPWLLPQNIKDLQGRRPNDPNYDPRTLFMAEKHFKGMSPAQAQYWRIKQQNQDVVLFFKVGKFYELFDEDAHVGVRELGLSYMKARGRPHAGFPEAAFDKYAEKLVHLNYKVGRVEQMETPAMMDARNKQNPGKPKAKTVHREMCSILTPGTLVDDSMIGHKDASYFLGLCEDEQKSEFGVCFVDTSTGSFHVGQMTDDRQRTRLRTLLAQIKPIEILVPRNQLTAKTSSILRSESSAKTTCTAVDPGDFIGEQDGGGLFRLLKPYFQDSPTQATAADQTQGLPAVLVAQHKAGHELALKAVGTCYNYLRRVLLDKEIISMGKFFEYDPNNTQSEYLVLDGQTLQNLEVLTNTEGGLDGTLLKHLDSTVTAFGKRMLKEWVSRPLGRVGKIKERTRAIEDLMQNEEELQAARKALKGLPDLERMLSRIHANGVPKETEAIMYCNVNAPKVALFCNSLEGFAKASRIPSIFAKLNCNEGADSEQGVLSSPLLRSLVTVAPPSELPSSSSSCPEPSAETSMPCDEDFSQAFPDISEELRFFSNAFNPKKALASGFILPHPGVDEEYDSANSRVQEVEDELEQYLEQQQEYFKTKDIKYKHSGKETFTMEIPIDKLNRAKLPSSFQLMGSTKKTKRFWSPTIQSLIPQLEEAKEEKEKLLKDLTRKMFAKFCKHYSKWQSVVDKLAQLDCLLSLALTSKYQDGPSCKPVFVPHAPGQSPLLEIRGGTHPALAGLTSSTFIPNDTVIGHKECPSRFVLVSGPNMGGKSTLLRQTCAIVIMAQLGCFVPADSCTLTPIDRIFTRVGANDRIMAGQSTFLVELEETANILRHATKRSLVILDELGRGTSTFDGTAIAYSVIKYLCERVDCLSLFSTHYHMLMEEFAQDARIAMYHMACNVDTDDQNVTFMYQFKQGTCPKSYGMNVANLAGLPDKLVQRAGEMSAKFEQLLESAHGKSSSEDIRMSKRILQAIQEGDYALLKKVHAHLQNHNSTSALALLG